MLMNIEKDSLDGITVDDIISVVTKDHSRLTSIFQHVAVVTNTAFNLSFQK